MVEREKTHSVDTEYRVEEWQGGVSLSSCMDSIMVVEKTESMLPKDIAEE
jgi:hypothetical protein